MSVHKERWSSIHATAHSAFKITFHDLHQILIIHICFELINIQSQTRCIFNQVREMKVLLIFKKYIMHFPELSLSVCRFSSNCRKSCVGMNFCKGKIPEDKLQ